ncbi:hypothetical protein [Kordia jejudonensis]|uniref:hypothetical protein n=1 Tax=Kordia jejudonensis TaxID=1348245 RepID=UPI0006297332|nr:hypothetical protein [Kordia jejudonensis]
MKINTKKIISEFSQNNNDNNTQRLIEVAKSKDFLIGDIANLANTLAKSGKVLNKEKGIYDIPSSGGPSSLSTLICPLVLSVYGKKVVKLGVPGRPAGGIDVLAQIEGYKYSLSLTEINNLNSINKYVHFLANDFFTPLDIFLFNYRKKNNSLNIPNLVIASILSKKIAVGVSNVGLDIRVSDFGNFGRTFNEAEANAKKFNKVANLVGIQSKCFITDGNSPQQPYIGRGESLVALKRIFTQSRNSLLKNHFDNCIRMSLSLIDEELIIKEKIVELLEIEFKNNIENQYGSYDSFLNYTEEIESKHKYNLIAESTGFINIDLYIIRSAICEIQNKFKSVNFSDPCGIILKVNNGQIINKNEIIATYRCHNDYKLVFFELIRKAFSIRTKYSNKENILIIK